MEEQKQTEYTDEEIDNMIEIISPHTLINANGKTVCQCQLSNMYIAITGYILECPYKDYE